ncbi:hypothetical protein [Edaphobacter modestus]|uniref:Homeodomain-like domain-containing protein n=1 Tax=Edaphobacter modestus TaxID=388466 RepID=A0A4Q7XYQ8_9BACT|nr:hypothetical protein [Edaphobacter modestus]RZU28901.1 hypothetical protein BDD14_6484 [Edaphobacter modestus]
MPSIKQTSADAASPASNSFRKPPKYLWTSDMDDQLRQVYRRARNRRELSVELVRLASTLKRPKYILANRAQTLALSLLPWKPWSQEELLKLRELAGEKSIRAIAKSMKRSVHSVKHQLFRMNVSAEVAEGYSIRQLQSLLGVNHSRIQMWVTIKALKMKQNRITEASVRKFVVAHMEEYSFKRVDEAWLKGLLCPTLVNGYMQNDEKTQEGP